MRDLPGTRDPVLARVFAQGRVDASDVVRPPGPREGEELVGLELHGEGVEVTAEEAAEETLDGTQLLGQVHPATERDK